jgi:hypothetical protein
MTVTRANLEAAIWRRWPSHDPIAAEAVDAILTLIDAHVRHVAGITAERRAVIDRPLTVRQMRDDTLPHQIRLTFRRRDRIAVSCTCRATGHDYKPLEVRSRWDAAEAQAVWRAHLAAPELHADAAS